MSVNGSTVNPGLLKYPISRILSVDYLAEWLRRQTRNLLGFTRAGSNPAVVVFYHRTFPISFLDNIHTNDSAVTIIK